MKENKQNPAIKEERMGSAAPYRKQQQQQQKQMEPQSLVSFQLTPNAFLTQIDCLLAYLCQLAVQFYFRSD